MMKKWPRRDPALPHQIVLFVSKQNGEGWGTVQVSCNCRVVGNPHRRNPYYESMGPAPDTQSAWRRFNDPNNHNNNNGVPFTSEWTGGEAVLRQAVLL